MRKLASIQEIASLEPIEGADKIELCKILGWQIVVKKGEYKIRDRVVFLEIDSWVPTTLAPFLSGDKEPREYKGVKGERLKTVKLRKQLSQGLVLPIPPGHNGAIGDDLTEALGILKWEMVEKVSGDKLGNVGRPFPYFLRKTDQERIQNCGKLAMDALDEQFEVTVKKDGSSLTVFCVQPSNEHYKEAKKMVEAKTKVSLFKRFLNLFKDAEPVYGICSRNMLLPLEGDSNFHKAVKKYDLLGKLKMMNTSYALQGELVSPNIQSNYEKVSDVEFHLFDIFSIYSGKYLLPEMRDYYRTSYHIPHATIVATGTLREIVGYKDGDNLVQKLLDYAEGPGDNPGVKREGVVFKCCTRDFSFKAVSNSYLLATGK